MIITRSPLRISLGGGGTDLPSYYREHEGFVIGGAIDKYVYLTLHQTFVPELIIKYSKTERVRALDEIQHPIIREALRLTEVPIGSLELTSMADIPAGTGLGSSGAFTTSLLKVLHTFKKNLVHPEELAEQACRIEIDLLGEPVGKQDQYAAAYGGLTCFRFLADGRVEAQPLKIDPDTLYSLEDNLLLFFTGYSRAASEILRDQDTRSRSHDTTMLEELHLVKRLGAGQPRRARTRRSDAVCRTDERPLGAQTPPLARHVERVDRRVVRPRHQPRRARRQAHRRRRRRLPDVLRRGQGPAPPRDAAGRASGGPVSLRL